MLELIPPLVTLAAGIACLVHMAWTKRRRARSSKGAR